LVADAEAAIKDLYWYYDRREYGRSTMDNSIVDHWSDILRLISH